jgi:putative addiction module component (TIGR02574 family)
VASGKEECNEMSPELLEIERKAFKLPVKEREKLAERLIQSLADVSLTEVEEAWVKEAERRFTAWRCGQRKGLSVKQAFKQIRKDLKGSNDR